MSRHEGVSCDNCLRSNFEDKRFKCLICYDYDLCERCYDSDVTTSRHLASHPMQRILTRNDFELFYGGENTTAESPPSFVCPFCAKLGFTESLLQEHVTKEHADVHTEVVCPVCAALPVGDPNLVTDDLAAHLTMEHRTPRDIDDPVGGRHIRRMFYPGRGLRTRNHRTMHFSGGTMSSSTISSSGVASNNNNTGGSATSAGRDTMDPIAEILSQLSGVRRSAQQLQQTVTTASQLQELQSQLQLERQRAAEIRQQLERFPNKIQNNGVAPNANAHPLTGAVVTKSATAAKRNQTQNAADTEDSRYLLSCLDEPNLTDTEKEKRSNEDNDRAQFVQELLLSLLSTDQDEPDQEDVTIQPLMPAPTPGRFSMERATPVECPLLSSTPTHADSAPTVADSPVTSLNQSNNHNDDTGVGNSMLTDNTNSPPGTVVSSSDHCQNAVAPAPADAGAVSSRSAPVLPTGAGDRKWRYRDADEKESDDDSDKPPSPTPMDQHRALTMQGRVLVAGGSPLGRLHRGGAINEYNRDEMATGGLSKHVH
uniref:RING-type E3 ubiquitin transferase n=1 Tax=Phallusia mammillata TaxID=59560 RepID=A0A6F9DG74_9ASCI|nr:E3 ubiquitin-protein ligase KCMF1 [Phallusia mammillata]